MLIKTGPDGDIPDFWYPVAPDGAVKLTYSLHLDTDYASVDEEAEVEFGFTCYPNPTYADLTLIFNLEENATVSAEIVDINGRVVQYSEENSCSIGQQFVHLDVNGLTKGIYVVRLKINDKYFYEKFVKQ